MAKGITRGAIVGTALAIGTLVTAQAVAISYSRSQHPALNQPAASEQTPAAVSDTPAADPASTDLPAASDSQVLGAPMTDDEQDDSELSDDEGQTSSSGGQLQTLPGAAQSAAGDSEDDFEPEESDGSDD